MEYWLLVIQNLLISFALPIAVGLIILIVQITKTENAKESIMKKTLLLVLVSAILVLILTKINVLLDDTRDPKANLFISDESFDSGTRGMASLYDDKPMPIWFESDLADIELTFLIDNIGTSYADIKKTILVIDDFEPITMEDILIFRTEHFAGVPPKAKASIDLSNIDTGQSEYDVNFTTYEVNKYGVSESETERHLERGEKFNVEQSNQTRLVTFLQLNKSGIYKYHLKVEYEYYKKPDIMETVPISFIYIAGDVKDYEYNATKMDSFHLERSCSHQNKQMYYDIDERILRIHNSEIVFRENDIEQFFSLINTIVVEDGTKEIDSGAFGEEPGLFNVSTIYLPKSLERFSLSSITNYGNLKTIYFEGTEEQWQLLVQDSDSNVLKRFEGVNIICECGSIPSEDELLQNHKNDENYYKL